MTKPATICHHYAVKAKPNRSGERGFVGSYCIPGKDEQFARDDENRIAVMDTQDEAIAAAGEDMCKALNSRHKVTSKHGYRRISGAELAVALTQIGVSPSQFAAHYGTSQARVMQWIDGEQDVPHAVNLLLQLLAVPGMVTLADRFTAATRLEREPAHEPG